MSEAEWRATLAEHMEKGPHQPKTEGATRDAEAIRCALSRIDALQEVAAMQGDMLATQAEMIRSLTEILTRRKQ